MDWLLDALIDSCKLIPFLFFAYVLIELIETFASKKLNDTKFLKGKWAPAVGSVIGVVPQCGFSVVATDLYSRKKITVGTLIAIFAVTSDEAIPILLSNLNSARSVAYLFALIAVKFLVGLIAGYLIDFLLNWIATSNAKAAAKKTHTPPTQQTEEHPAQTQDNMTDITNSQTATYDLKDKSMPKTIALTSANNATTTVDKIETKTYKHDDHDHKHQHEHAKDSQEPLNMHKGCCGHDIEEDHIHPAKQYVLHPLVHTLKVFAYILIVNLIFSACIFYLGEDNIAAFLQSSIYLAPLLACVIGLIPNCASSVVLTNLLVIGGLSFSACVAGLIVNAGIAYVVLFKQNKNQKANFAIIGTMFAIGLIVGYGLLLFGV